MRLGRSIWCAFWCLFGIGVHAASEPVDFNREIRPLLSDRCFKCHGPDGNERKAKLRFDTSSGLQSAKESGVIVPRRPSESELVRRLFSADSDEVMPPPDSLLKLSVDERELIRRWVAEGTDFSRHWSFVTPRRPALPAVSNERWCRNEIDRFVLERLDAEKLEPSPSADSRTLIRRVSLDVTGIPPTGAEADVFAARSDESAYAQLVERLLKSERYGERMAVDWLDAARYADTSGLLYDWPRTMWRYRDFVIDAFNRNLSYRDFLIWQLAGDLLPEPTPDQLIATGFNRNHPFTVEAGVIDEEYRVNYVNDRVTTMGTAIMGLTLECARCHDHKFDAISQQDYYQLFAFFNNLPEAGVMAGHATYGSPAVGTPSKSQYRRLEELEERLINLDRQLNIPDANADRRQIEWERTAQINIWQPISPTGVRSGQGAQMQVQTDGSVLVAGPNPPVDQHVIEFEFAEAKTVTGIRLEAMLDRSMPRGGPGRSANGNALVTFVSVGQYSAEDKHDILTLSAAGADYSQSGFPVDGAIDTAPRTGWAVAGNRPNEARSAVFEFTKPARFAAGDRMEIKIYYGAPFPQHVFGRFRWSITDTDAPVRLDPSGVVDRLVRLPKRRRQRDQEQFVRYFYRATASLVHKFLADAIRQAEKEKGEVLAAIPQTMIMQDQPGIRATHVLQRGAYDRPGKLVMAGSPEHLPVYPPAAPKNRLGLAAWLTSRDQPLTARVFVNRIWAQFFGRGLVKTVEDFGSQGDWPSHPKLLDWLAVDFMENGWDVKRLVRQIVMSNTYRQASATSPEQLERDAENRLLARGSRFRLSAEMVRDSALAVSGLLREEIGGPSVKPYQPAGLWRRLTNRREYRQNYEPATGDGLYRRSVYTYWKRAALHPAMAAFDAPTREVCTVRRRLTNTPQQALVLLNDPQFVEAARGLAAKVMGVRGLGDDQRLTEIFLAATARRPTKPETMLLKQLLQSQRRRFEADESAAEKLLAVGESPSGDHPLPELAAFTGVARAILNLSETITRN